MERIEDRHLREIQMLTAPKDVKQQLPVPPPVAEHVLGARAAVRDAVHGRDPHRLVVVVGPCSLHDEQSALEYADCLAPLARELEDDLLIVMRAYFEKPRTTVGWKGLINDPHLDGSCDIPHGLELARRLLLEIGERGLPCATEFLDPVTPQYTSDLVAWAAIGARTTESQTHREMASGLSMPVGFKNGTDGSLDGAVNAMTSAGAPHSFLGIDVEGRSAVVHTKGNPDRHLVLRGGSGGPNHDPETLARAAERAAGEGAARGVMVDCSHDNSGKDPARQPEVARAVLAGEAEVARRLNGRGGAGRPLLGLMLESHLEPGSQPWSPGRPLRRGISITDACLGWPETETLLRALATRG